ncbi:hypothetical protein [Aquamicrobium soli]|uniref:DUF3606 domain-containing protein n=1 Tax=Aquamicrobium soli TaxID=1811518 RepID=A0ABV7KAR6_9HYPH
MNAPISKQVAEQAIFAAARWYVANRETIRQRQGHVVPELRNRFGLTPRQAIEAIRHANAAEQKGS